MEAASFSTMIALRKSTNKAWSPRNGLGGIEPVLNDTGERRYNRHFRSLGEERDLSEIIVDICWIANLLGIGLISACLYKVGYLHCCMQQKIS